MESPIDTDRFYNTPAWGGMEFLLLPLKFILGLVAQEPLLNTVETLAEQLQNPGCASFAMATRR